MNDFIERRRRKPDYIETAQVTEHTAKRIAIWCGGSWGHERDRGSDTYLEIVVPNIAGNLKAHVNDYVVRKEDGRFYVMKPAEMTEYEIMGQREGIKVVDLTETPKLTPHYVPRGKHPFG
jgi:hypothetical protein